VGKLVCQLPPRILLISDIRRATAPSRASRAGPCFDQIANGELESLQGGPLAQFRNWPNLAKRKADTYGPETTWHKIKNRAYTQAESQWELLQKH
jgi:hypothetical protein